MTDHVNDSNQRMWERERQQLVDACEAKDKRIKNLEAEAKPEPRWAMAFWSFTMILVGAALGFVITAEISKNDVHEAVAEAKKEARRDCPSEVSAENQGWEKGRRTGMFTICNRLYSYGIAHCDFSAVEEDDRYAEPKVEALLKQPAMRRGRVVGEILVWSGSEWLSASFGRAVTGGATLSLAGSK